MWGRSFLIARIRGIPVRAHWAFFVVLPLLFLYEPLVEIRRHPGGAEWFLFNLVQMFSLVIAVVCHEFAHALTALRFRAHVHNVVLWPLGGFTQISEMTPQPSANILLSLSGPLCNLALGLLAYALPLPQGRLDLYLGVFGWWNLLLGGLNLIPAIPLDGGEALRTALRSKLGHGRGDRLAAQIGIGATVCVVILGLALGRPILVFIAVVTGLSSYNLLRQSRFAGHSAEPRLPETGDFRAWRLPKRELDAEIRRRRAIEKADRQVRERVDRLLRKITEKGINSLSEEDRAFLDQTSRRLRG